MGKRGRDDRGGKGKGNGKGNSGGPYDTWGPPIVKENKLLVNYYTKLDNVIPAAELDSFIATMKLPLPSTFRINQTSHFAKIVRDKLESDYKKGPVTLTDGSVVQPPHPIDWYPNNGAWIIDSPRKELRKNEELSQLHQFLKAQTEWGNISRQEMVSMVPVFFLDVNSSDKVLDMCAAPGSKTSQLLEFMGAIPTPDGVVVANDASQSRCDTLVHQIKRLNLNCMVTTCHEAQRYPLLKTPDTKSGYFEFSKILCDVPCSGDGTFRKNIALWKNWTPAHALGLHKLQCAIALRGITLLSEGGRMVYSTCSLNPVEDEAVLQLLLTLSKGALRLVDVSSKYPNLKRMAGISKWSVSADTLKFYDSYSEVSETDKKRIFPTHFPLDNAASLNLHYAMRILPHHQDSGGFFVAVLEKVAPLYFSERVIQAILSKKTTWEDLMAIPISKSPYANGATEQPEIQTEIKADPEQEQFLKELAAAAENDDEGENNKDQNNDDENEDQKPNKKQKTETNSKPKNTNKNEEGDGEGEEDEKRKKRKEEPFLPLSQNLLNVLKETREWYGISENFPMDQLMCRSDTSPKIYSLSKYVSSFLRAEPAKLNTVNTGLKVFEKQSGKLGTVYRIVQDGIDWIAPFVSKRKIDITVPDLKCMLRSRDTYFDSLSELALKQVKDCGGKVGSVILVISEGDAKGMHLTGFLGHKTLSLYAPKQILTALKNLQQNIPNPNSAPSTTTSTTTSTTSTTTTTSSETKQEDQKMEQ